MLDDNFEINRHYSRALTRSRYFQRERERERERESTNGLEENSSNDFAGTEAGIRSPVNEHLPGGGFILLSHAFVGV